MYIIVIVIIYVLYLLHGCRRGRRWLFSINLTCELEFSTISVQPSSNHYQPFGLNDNFCIRTLIILFFSFFLLVPTEIFTKIPKIHIASPDRVLYRLQILLSRIHASFSFFLICKFNPDVRNFSRFLVGPVNRYFGNEFD